MEAGRSVDSSKTRAGDGLRRLTEVVQVLCPGADRFEYPQAAVAGIGRLFRHDKLSATEPL